MRRAPSSAISSRPAPSRRRFLKLGVAGIVAGPTAAFADVKLDTLLRISCCGKPDIALGEAQIRGLPWVEVRTHTNWTTGLQTFRGPLLRDVLATSGETRAAMEGRSLRLLALNDFTVTMPAADAWAHDPILAREQGGVPMQVRDKGPLWLVYPRDGNPELQTAAFDERWVWQLARIDIL